MDRKKLLNTAFILSIITIIYNLVEGVISVYFGIEDDTLSLLGFGTDSFVEVISGIGIAHMVLRMKFSKVEKVFIAGGFGTSLDIESAVKIGLLPDLPRDKFTFIGNSALTGARQMLLSVEATKLAEEIARKVTYFELSVDSGYMDEYMAALFFPHTDLNRFPSTKHFG